MTLGAFCETVTCSPFINTLIQTRGSSMTKWLLFCLTACSALSLSARADEPVEVVRTVGTAELETVSNFLLFSSSTKTPVRIPEVISAGESIRIQYVVSGKTVVATFPVVDISIRGNLCWLHSKQRTQYDSTLGDTIYVQPCRRIR